MIKSREVEDPVNLWLHRPLAYGFCWLVYRTPMTPNQITFLAILLGLSAASCWIVGTPSAMVWGGILLWSSAIMDGADGILARAKNMQSAFGRALDGTADLLVGLVTVSACVYRLQQQGAGAATFVMAGFAFMTTLWGFNLYDFYKELYLRHTRLDRGGESNTATEAAVLQKSNTVKTAPWYTRAAMALYADYLAAQQRLILRTNAPALALLTGHAHSAESADIYREHNRGSMRMWMAISLAPHSYLFAIFAMFDRFDLYLWLRVSLMLCVMLTAIVSQRGATRRTLEALRGRGMLAPDEAIGASVA